MRPKLYIECNNGSARAIDEKKKHIWNDWRAQCWQQWCRWHTKVHKIIENLNRLVGKRVEPAQRLLRRWYTSNYVAYRLQFFVVCSVSICFVSFLKKFTQFRQNLVLPFILRHCSPREMGDIMLCFIEIIMETGAHTVHFSPRYQFRIHLTNGPKSKRMKCNLF